MIVFGIKFENNHYSKSICQYHKYIFWILQWGNGLDQVEPPVVKDHDPFSMSLWRSVWPLTFILALQNGFKLDFNCLCLLDNYLLIPQWKMKDLFDISWCLLFQGSMDPRHWLKIGPGLVRTFPSEYINWKKCVGSSKMTIFEKKNQTSKMIMGRFLGKIKIEVPKMNINVL